MTCHEISHSTHQSIKSCVTCQIVTNDLIDWHVTNEFIDWFQEMDLLVACHAMGKTFASDLTFCSALQKETTILKIFKGCPPLRCPLELVQKKTVASSRVYHFLTDFCRAEMINSTRLYNKTSTAWSYAEDQILENKISGTGFSMFVLNDKLNAFQKSNYL